MIDQWYENVYDYYHTDPSSEQEPELKRFHDEKGHRIKFSKDLLQCTYGLRVLKKGSKNYIEISVNNKVEALDYEEFLRRLDNHYQNRDTVEQRVGNESSLHQHSDIFLLEPDFQEAFSVEQEEGKADVIRLNFRVNPEKIPELTDNPETLKTSIEEYCLSPLRRIYADLYRKSLRRK